MHNKDGCAFDHRPSFRLHQGRVSPLATNISLVRLHPLPNRSIYCGVSRGKRDTRFRRFLDVANPYVPPMCDLWTGYRRLDHSVVSQIQTHRIH